MLFRLISDMHLEQEAYQYIQTPNLPELPHDPRDKDAILLLAGDICELGFMNHHVLERFAENISGRFKQVLYVPGNHEYWNHDSFGYGTEMFEKAREYFAERGITLLDDDNVEVDGVIIHGTTLWTDYYNQDPEHMFACTNLYEFTEARTFDDDLGSIRLTNQNDIIERNRVSRNILHTLPDDKPIVVMSHFAPSRQSITTRYLHYKSNAHYVNDLDDFIFNKPNIKLWVHGHVHSQHDYMIGETRIVCNPLGFEHEQSEHTKDLNFIEISVP